MQSACWRRPRPWGSRPRRSRNPPGPRGNRRLLARAGAALALAALAACDGGTAETPATAPAEQAQASPWSDDGPYLFRDATEAAGLSGFAQVAGSPEKPFLVETVGGGCALFDQDR